ncbi:hypothetical protein BGX23_009484 [Mortierella sp. AD031]|nr:hypothetical protein BGX23_009484 [Mortierella sp. AD031]
MKISSSSIVLSLPAAAYSPLISHGIVAAGPGGGGEGDSPSPPGGGGVPPRGPKDPPTQDPPTQGPKDPKPKPGKPKPKPVDF